MPTWMRERDSFDSSHIHHKNRKFWMTEVIKNMSTSSWILSVSKGVDDSWQIKRRIWRDPNTWAQSATLLNISPLHPTSSPHRLLCLPFLYGFRKCEKPTEFSCFNSELTYYRLKNASLKYPDSWKKLQSEWMGSPFQYLEMLWQKQWQFLKGIVSLHKNQGCMQANISTTAGVSSLNILFDIVCL